MFLKNLQVFGFGTKLRFSTRYSHTWISPEGHRTPINIYNCVTRQKDPLIVKNKNVVTWYTCGPTVYDASHIGHASCYVKLDVIQRILKQYFGLNLVTCMNITDIDDKIIKKASETGNDYREVSKRYEKEFWEDIDSLGIPRPDVVVRVTENVPLIIDFIKKLEGDGVAYKGQDNSVYFDVYKGCQHYGKLQNIGETFPDPKNPNKKCPADFALWKSSKNESEPFFDSPWGPGRPGWHIECSALASYIFGNNVDIHAGGIDLRFPHHENEEAQSCAFHQSNQWVNYWIHTGHLHLKDSEKMSKSLKNTVSIRDMLKETTPEVFRLSCAMSHYFSPIEYSSELLQTSHNLVKVYKNFVNTCADIENGFLRPSLNEDVLHKLIHSSVKDIKQAICDDFNTPSVIQTLNQIVSKTNSMVHSTANSRGAKRNLCNLLALKKIVCDTLDIFGVKLIDSRTSMEQEDATEFIEMLVNVRQEIRNIGLKEKNQDLLNICDNIRSSLSKTGVNLKDHGKVTSWSR